MTARMEKYFKRTT